MKNIHILPTDKPSRLCLDNSCDELNYSEVEELNSKHITNQNIYITSDEEIIGGKEWFLDLRDNFLFKNQVNEPMNKVLFPNCKKIILTTDQDLINDGVQAIDDEFLEWFVKNPSCEEIEVVDDTLTVKEMSLLPLGTRNHKYKIIIPKEEPKQDKMFLDEFTGRHYETKAIDVIDFCKLYDLNFNEGNVIKYVSRARRKGTHVQDLKKAIDYLNRELKYLENGVK